MCCLPSLSSVSMVSMSKDDLLRRNIVTGATLDLCTQLYGNVEVFAFEKILFLYVLDKALQSGDINIEEGKLLLSTLTENYARYRREKLRDCIPEKDGRLDLLSRIEPL